MPSSGPLPVWRLLHSGTDKFQKSGTLYRTALEKRQILRYLSESLWFNGRDKERTFTFYNEKRWHQNFDRETQVMVYFDSLAQKQASAWNSARSSLPLINPCYLFNFSRTPLFWNLTYLCRSILSDYIQKIQRPTIGATLIYCQYIPYCRIRLCWDG